MKVRHDVNWYSPAADQPECDCGDRIVGIAVCRAREDSPLLPQLVILTATETGWENEYGFDLEDLDLWTYESAITEAVRHIADAR